MINLQKHKEQFLQLFRSHRFRTGLQSTNHRVFDLVPDHELKPRFEIFMKLIEDFLEKRSTIYKDNVMDTVNHNNNNILTYVYDMCESIQKEFRGDITLDEIISLDSQCAGHVDYCYKFALRLAELESEI